MNRLVKYTMTRLGRLQPMLGKIQKRAQKRQDAWLKRREGDVDSLKGVALKFRDKAVDFIGEWVEIEGLTKSSSFEVRAHENIWGVFEKGGKGVPVATYSKKSEAVDEGKRRARQRGGHLEVLTKQGAVQSRFTYQPA